MWDPREDAWLAGFADGEGTFRLNHQARPRWGRQAVNPQFGINLRADDVPVLRSLKDAFGGNVNFSARVSGGSAPRYFWNVCSKADLARLVDYFDRFPLRAKKARDYAIWRQAVLIYVAHGGVEPFAELMALREALMAGRVYDEQHEPTPLRRVV